MTILARPHGALRWLERQRPPGEVPGDLGVHADDRTLRLAASLSRWLVMFALLLALGTAWLPGLAGPVTFALAGAGLVAGVPHGAIDHLMATRLAHRRQVVLVTVAYAAMAMAAWLVLAWAGAPALTAVIILSALHFGLGELEVWRQLTGWRPGRIPAVAAVVAGCGALLLPLARCGDQLTAVASAVSPDIASFLGSSPVRASLVVVWLVSALIAVTAAVRSGHRAIALDVLIVAVLASLAPPLVAFAVWFGGWHALRHCARMLTVEPGCARLVASGRLPDAARRFAKLAALPSIAALTVLVVLGWFTANATDPNAVVAESLRLLLALTVPHMVVVLWLDRQSRSRV